MVLTEIIHGALLFLGLLGVLFVLLFFTGLFLAIALALRRPRGVSDRSPLAQLLDQFDESPRGRRRRVERRFLKLRSPMYVPADKMESPRPIRVRIIKRDIGGTGGVDR